MDSVDTSSMVEQVKLQGMEARTIEPAIGEQIDFSVDMANECVVCYGDINFVRQVHRRAPYIPGAWCDFNNMKCSTYYAYFGKYLLNKQYFMMPVEEVLRRWNSLTASGSLFIRPDSGTKPFTGYVVRHDEKHEIQTLIDAVGNEILVVVAPEKKITTEWRFVICDGKVVAGCQYLPWESPDYDTHALCLAIEIGRQQWQPDLCYTVDIAECDGEMHLLEINSFSCAGLYGCNMESVVRYASEVAEEEWQEYL